MYGQIAPTFRLKSRKFFLNTSEKPSETPSQSRIAEWKTQITNVASERWIESSEKLPPEHNRPVNMEDTDQIACWRRPIKRKYETWGYEDQNITCKCGKEQTMSHLLQCPMGPSPYTQDELMTSSQRAVDVARFWSEENI